MTSKERFQLALAAKPLDRPPIWVMRQAGRYLPEYRALKERYSFLQLVKTPDLAAEVTLQPLKRFSLDAAILFSDILVIPEALGQGYHFSEKGGIGMNYRIASRSDLDRLNVSAIPEKLSYVYEALTQIKIALQNEKMLLGFGGSPWTLACYMVEGGASKNFDRIKGLYFEDRDSFDLLLERVTEATIAYFQMQIEAGVDAIQIFDSWGHVCPQAHMTEMSLQWISRILARLPKGFPVIYYGKAVSQHALRLARMDFSALSVDWSVDMHALRHILPERMGIQGNLDPTILLGARDVVIRETKAMIEIMKGHPGYIFNLGHGVLPLTPVENMEALVETVIRGALTRA